MKNLLLPVSRGEYYVNGEWVYDDHSGISQKIEDLELNLAEQIEDLSLQIKKINYQVGTSNT